MKRAVIVDAVRLPFGRAHAERGYYRDRRADDLAAACVKTLVARSGIDPLAIEDLIVGCTQQSGEQGLNVARTIALLAGLPSSSAGCTVNRLCGSGLQALVQAAHAVQADQCDVQIAAGVEHMHHFPMDHGLDVNPRLYAVTSKAALHMGITAEFLAQTERISRSEQDEFALRSHTLASEAFAAGSFAPEITPTEVRSESGELLLTERDQSVREDSTLAALSALEPAFVPKYGTVTAGNSSPLNDGAAALLVMSEDSAARNGLTPLAHVVASAVAGVEPCLMGTGPVPASQKLLARAGLSVSDIGLWEINEAFAAQALACVKMLGLDLARVNVRGGALAIGHPLGASGVRIAGSLAYAMRERDVRFGVATMCIGLGQGIAVLLERRES